MPISSELIQSVTASLYERSLKRIPEDTKLALKKALGEETEDLAKSTLFIMLDSADMAQREDFLVCTDIGFPVYSIKIGTGVSFQGRIRQAIEEGFAHLAATIQPPILKMVTNPLTLERGYAGKNVPIVTFDLIDDADYIEIVCSPQSMGAGRWAAMELFTYPTLETIERYVLNVILKAGSQPCSPMVVGVGIGGTFDYAAKMAKEAALRPMGQTNPEPILADMEERLLKAINDTGFGPMGTGGKSTAMAVHIDYSFGHGFTPVAVYLNCWINRRARARIYDNGTVVQYE